MKDVTIFNLQGIGSILKANRRGVVSTPTALTTDPESPGRRLLDMILAHPYTRHPQLRTMVQPVRIRTGVSACPETEVVSHLHR